MIDSATAVVGAMLQDNSCIEVVQRHISPDDLFGFNGKVFDAILTLRAKNQVADIITVGELLGDPVKVSELTSSCPYTGNAEFYAVSAKKEANKRKLIHISSEIREQLTEGQDIESIVQYAQKEVMGIDGGVHEYSNLGRKCLELTSDIEKHINNPEPYTGVRTGLNTIDDITDGFQNGDFILIGARPSKGKTALMLTMAVNSMVKWGVKSGIFELEMSEKQLLSRAVAMLSRVNSQKIRKGLLTKLELDGVMGAMENIYQKPIFVIDDSSLTVNNISSIARRMVRQDGVQIIYIDYITLINMPGDNPRHEKVSEVSRQLKALARELSVPVVALSQLTRDTEGKRPTLASIRDSGSLEQDADCVIFIHGDWIDRREIVVAKQRNGPTGDVTLRYDAAFTLFREDKEDE